MEDEKTTTVLIKLPNDINEYITLKLMEENKERNKFQSGYKTKSQYLSELVIQTIRSRNE